MDQTSPFGEAYAKETGVSPQPTSQTAPTQPTSPFGDAYKQETGVSPTMASSSNEKATRALAVAKHMLGEKAFQGFCQQFVEQLTGDPIKKTSAITAWQNYATSGKAKKNLAGIKEGDAVYFTPNAGNENYGHVGIYSGKGNFISATDNGIQENNLDGWQKSTGQQLLGYVPLSK